MDTTHTVPTTPAEAGLTDELAWKVFLDRYARKDINRCFQPGDLAVVKTVEGKWSQKEIALVGVPTVGDNGVTVRFLTGEHAGETAVADLRDCDRPIETSLEETARRIARGVAAAEPEDQRDGIERVFAEEIAARRLVPAGRIWAGAGLPEGELTLNNCYVLACPHDSRHGIVRTLEQMVETMSRGGGVGFTVSSLRPTGSVVRGVNGHSSGAVSWMDLYSWATGLVEQAGSRRGALMLQIDDWHPDLIRFIECKQVPGEIKRLPPDVRGRIRMPVENANVSVRIGDAFMQAVERDEEWELLFPDTTHHDYDQRWDGDLEHWRAAGRPVVVYERYRARDLWKRITDAAWASAEPGIVFKDRIKAESNSYYYARLVSSNPCGEEPLPAFGVCNLAHVHLARFFDPTGTDGPLGGVDWSALRATVRIGVRFLDDVVDVTPYHLPEIAEQQRSERRLGLGTLGLAELLIRMGIRYGSPECLVFLRQFYGFIRDEGYLASTELACERGPFPRFNAEKFLQSGFCRRLPENIRTRIRQRGIRNVTVFTQAPTGTVGAMMNTSTGIEPFYSFRYFRKSRLGTSEQFVPLAAEWQAAHPGEALPPHFVTAMDLTPEEHVRVQASIQQYVDASISKTANAPAGFSHEQTAELYELAYKLGCKGVTIYRDGSRHEQVLSTTGQDTESAQPEPHRARPRPRPEAVDGATLRMDSPVGTLFVTLNRDTHGPLEVFLHAGKGGSDIQADAEAIGRLVSLCLRSGVNPHDVIDQLSGIGGRESVGIGKDRVRSMADAVARAMRETWYAYRETAAGPAPEAPTTDAAPERNGRGHLDLCPGCGEAALVFAEGCATCLACGHSRC